MLGMQRPTTGPRRLPDDRRVAEPAPVAEAAPPCETVPAGRVDRRAASAVDAASSPLADRLQRSLAVAVAGRGRGDLALLQRAVDVTGGAFKDDRYEPQVGSTVGAKMVLLFQPSLYKLKQAFPGVEAHPMQIHLIQIVREIHQAQPIQGAGLGAQQGNVGYGARTVAAGPHSGWGVDMDWAPANDAGYVKIANARRAHLDNEIARLGLIAQPSAQDTALLAQLTWQRDADIAKTTTHKTKGTTLTSLDPRYAQQRVTESAPLFVTKEVNESSGNAAVFTPSQNKFNEPASLRDAPSVPIGNAMLGMEFEVAALLEHGAVNARAAVYLGSVCWGWQRSPGKSDVKLTPLAKVSTTAVSAAFTAAVTHWNQLTVSDPRTPGIAAHPVMQIPTA